MPAPVLYIHKKGRTAGKLNSPQNISPMNHRNKYKNRCYEGVAVSPEKQQKSVGAVAISATHEQHKT